MSAEARLVFDCFGSTCEVAVRGDEPGRTATAAAAAARSRLLDWHRRFTRFDPMSELSLVNGDPQTELRVSPVMARLAYAVATSGRSTRGLVDGTLLGSLEAAGYAADLRRGVDLQAALQVAPPRRPAGPSPAANWSRIDVDFETLTLRRPPGVAIDSGGLAKGLFADMLAEGLGEHHAFAIDCAGDVRIGGAANAPQPVFVESPFDGSILHRFTLRRAAVATSGIGRRSWRGPDGAPRHHLLDPATGEPAFTGIVQATAVAPTGIEAELRAKAAVLSGPAGARAWLADGGLLVFDDGSYEVVPARLRPVVRLQHRHLDDPRRSIAIARSG
jgi:thiamine biosynthesis lipoprotein